MTANSIINWEEFLNSRNNINNMFTAIGLNNYKVRNIEKNIYINRNRSAVIVTVEEKGSDKLYNFCIDGKSGLPTWKQMLDCTFEFGKDCDKRIILYDGHKNSEDYYLDKMMAINFAILNNKFHIDTEVICCDSPISDEGKEQFTFKPEDTRSNEIYFSDIKDYPTKEELRYLESYIYIDHLRWLYINYYPLFNKDTLEKEDIDNREEYQMHEKCELELQDTFASQFSEIEGKELSIRQYLEWSTDGLYHMFDVNDGLGLKVFKWMLCNHYNKINKLLYNLPLNITNGEKPLYSIGIKYIDESIDIFEKHSSIKKIQLLKDLVKRKYKIEELYEDLIYTEYSDYHDLDEDEWFDVLKEHFYNC